MTISVVIPTYNRRELLSVAVQSALEQTLPPDEIIVVDDGSDDQTSEALERFGEIVQYHWQENQGESVARNKGIAMSTGQFVAFLDSDDLWLPSKLARQRAFMDEHPECGMIVSSAQLIDARGDDIPNGLIGQNVSPADLSVEGFCRKNAIPTPSGVMVRRTVLDESGGFDPKIRYGEDWELWLRIAAVTEIRVLDDVLAKVRRHRGGQWHYPKAERIDRQLADHLLILATAQRLAPADSSIDWDRLHAQKYLAAYLDASASQVANAAQYFERVIELCPALLGAWQSFGMPLTSRALLIAETDEGLEPGIARAYVDKVLSDLGKCQIDTKASMALARQIRSEVGAGLAHLAFRRRSNIECIRQVLASYRWCWRRIADRGLASILARSMWVVLVQGARRR